jgi:hypothetical protein
MRSICGYCASGSGAFAKLLLGALFLCFAAMAAATPVAPRPAGLQSTPAAAAIAAATAADYRLSTAAPPISPMPMLPGVAKLGGGQEVLFSLPAAFGFDLLSHGSLDDAGGPLDRLRATYRYTWLSRDSWEIKVGLSTTVASGNSWQRFLSPSADRLRPGNLPSMHISSEGRLADRWLLSLSADGMLTGRGQGLDMDLRVDYGLTRNVALFGSYRLTDSTGAVPEFYGFVPSNTARLGVRLRF